MKNLVRPKFVHPAVSHEFLADKKYLFSHWTEEWVDEMTMIHLMKVQNEFIKEYSCQYLLNDGVKYRGSTPKIQKWLSSDWAFEAYNLGLRYIAIVLSEDIFGKVTVQEAVKENRSQIVAEIFTDITLAERWLLGRMNR